MTCEEFEELSGAYALDAVTPTERRAAEAHLATCEKCKRLLQELRGIVALLPLSVPQISPAPELQQRVMAAIQQESKTNAGAPPRQVRRARPLQRWSVQLLAVAAMLFLLLVGSSVWNITLAQQVSSLRQQLTSIQQASSSYVTVFTVKSANQQARPLGQVLYYARQNITVITVSGLPQLQGAHVYQGWLLRQQGASITGVYSMGLLNVENGTATLSYTGSINGYNATAISLEPGPSATPNAPKGQVLAISTLQ